MRNDEGQVVGASFDLTKPFDSQPALYWLPTLRAKTASICLPLSRGGGQQLAGALIESDARNRCGRLSEVLANEPAFALWAILKRDKSDVDSIPHLLGLSEWLAASGPVIFLGTSHRERHCAATSEHQIHELT